MMTTEQWANLGTTLGVIYVAIRTELRGRAAAKEHKVTQKAVASVAVAVDGPLTESLRATASALTQVARLTGSDVDILAAVAARKRADEHLEHAADIVAFKRELEAKVKTKLRS